MLLSTKSRAKIYLDITSIKKKDYICKMKEKIYIILFFVCCLLFTGCSKDEISGDTTTCIKPENLYSPTAEYDRAGIVLVNSPQEEYTNGDLESVQNEHKQYVSLLKNDGIQVYDIAQILPDIPIDSLRLLAKSIVNFNFGNINTSYDKDTLENKILNHYQTNELVKFIKLVPTIKLNDAKGTDISINYTNTALTCLIFTRDQSISTPDGEIIGCMNRDYRKPETKVVDFCYNHIGFKPIYHLKNENSRLEGGDYLPFGTLAFIANGIRTNMSAIDELMSADVLGHDTIAVVKDNRNYSHEMHLDTYFNIIDKKLVVMSKDRFYAEKTDNKYLTIDLYTRAPGTKSYMKTETSSLIDFLDKRGVKIIPISTDKYGANFLCIGNRHILAVEGQSDDYVKAMNENGVTIEWVPFDKILISDGAAHCLTQVLKREKTY